MIDRPLRLPSPRWFRRSIAVWAGIGLTLATAGCVERRMTIRTTPPGATVFIDDYEIGTTPVAANFTYYGTRKIRLVKDGYETLTVLQPVSTPWFEYFGIDFVTENLVPGKIRDQQTFCYQLRPQAVIPSEQLLTRAEQLRQGSQAPPPPLAQPGVPPAMPPTTGVLPTPAPGGNWMAPQPAMPPTPGQQSFAPPGAPPPSGPAPAIGSQPLYTLPPPGPTGP
jgi:hypothetical protein